MVLSFITGGLYSLYWYYYVGSVVESLHDCYSESNGSGQLQLSGYLVLGIFSLGIISMALIPK